MKTKFLIGALALSSGFVACTNEIEEVYNENTNMPISEIVGADLVSKGLTIKANVSGVDSRANANGWENDDPVGLAWYNATGNLSTKNALSSSTSIFDEQKYDFWESVVYNENAVTYGKNVDHKIYNNILFNYANGDFTTKANVYQGAYIAYFPHQYMSQIAPLSFNVQQEQADDATVEQYNKALHISAQDFISVEDAMEGNGVLTSEFYLYPIVNTLKVVTTPVAKIQANELLKNMSITNVTVKQNQALFNIETGEINPWTVPAIQYEEDGITVDEEGTKVLMDAWAKTLGTSAVKNLSTDIADELTLSLAGARTVRLFTLPTEEVAGTNGSIEVSVVSNGIAVGKFVINKSDANTANKNAIVKLNELTTEEGYTASDNQTYSLQEIMRNADGKAVAQNLRINLTAANFVPATTSIKTLAQWDELVDVINAMYAIDKNISVPTFKLSKDIEFVNGEIKVPACGVKVNTNGKKMIIASENVVWPNSIELVTNSKGEVTGKLAVEVKEDASLYVNGTKKMPATLAATEITNMGEIYANAYASISTSEDMTLNNKDGRVIVEFGSYVYPSNGNEGDIVFVVDENTKIANVNTLIDGGNLGSANVNTLIVRTTLDLNAPATKSTADDRYFEGNDATSLTESIKNINIELEDGSLVHVKAGNNTTVANVKAVSGENSIDDVVVSNDLIIEEGATLNVEGITTPVAKIYEVTDIDNKGNLNVNVKTLNVTNISNTNGGYIEVATGYKVVYTGDFTQVASTYKGTIELFVPVNPTVALAQTVMSKFDACNFAGAKVTTYNKLVEHIHKYGNDGQGTQAFYDALVAWYAEALPSTTFTYSNLTVSILKNFEDLSGYKFGLTD